MMAAYAPQPGAMHPAMAAHGHPAMTPGQPMNPAQMQQMGHPGVSGPGQAHVSQAGAMMGMQPGANGMVAPAGMGGQHPGAQMGGMPGQIGGQSMASGVPNAHALSHLTPQAQMQQQQQLMQQQMQNNPHMAMQQHQQALMQRRMQQMQANGMGGMPQGAMQGMNPQQMQQLQQMQQNNPGMHPQSVQLPQHLQAQQMQLMRQQQQQAAQQNQLQQQLAMQQANSNQGSQPGPPQQGGQAQHPGQIRPQSRMANPNEQNQGGPQQTVQQATQGQQQQQSQPNQQQAQQQNSQQPGQQQQMSQQQMQAMQQRRMQMQAMQQQQQNAAMQRQMQAQQFAGLQGQLILRFMQMCDGLSSFNEEFGKDIDQWRNFVDKHFSPDAELMHFVLADNNRQKGYKVPRSTIARYFQMYFDSGAQSIRLHPEHAREQPAQANRSQVTFGSATFTVSYANGARLEMVGTMIVLFVREATGTDFIEHMEFHTTSSEEIIKRSEIEQLLNNWSPTMANKASPKMTKNKLPKAQQKMQSQFEGLTVDHFPKAQKGTSGVTAKVQHFLEIGETLNLMSDLMAFAQDKRLRPDAAIDALVTQYQREGGPEGQQMSQQGNPQINLPPNGVPVGNRTPSMQHMQIPNAQGQFSSPSMSNLGLPMQNGIPGMNGSPHIANNPGLAPNMNMVNSHTPSPHQSNMAAPPMVPQHSQQGTNSSAASANTSPNVNNKRRRSTVKMEGDEGGGDSSQGANRVKPSPRMGKKAKPGGA